MSWARCCDARVCTPRIYRCCGLHGSRGSWEARALVSEDRKRSLRTRARRRSPSRLARSPGGRSARSVPRRWWRSQKTLGATGDRTSTERREIVMEKIAEVGPRLGCGPHARRWEWRRRATTGSAVGSRRRNPGSISPSNAGARKKLIRRRLQERRSRACEGTGYPRFQGDRAE